MKKILFWLRISWPLFAILIFIGVMVITIRPRLSSMQPVDWILPVLVLDGFAAGMFILYFANVHRAKFNHTNLK